ncbi:MAG: sulfite exporter TauE/SafE family protein [Thiohalomonadaceae bacterium]
MAALSLEITHVVLPLVTALLLGLFSTVHCIGMCGGISGALTFSLPEEVRRDNARLGLFLTCYNAGRIFSYAAAGALVGYLGGTVYAAVSPAGGYTVIQTAAALLMVAVGLYVGGWFPRFAALERIGIPVWRRLEPIGRRLIPVRHPVQALTYGVIWGWLPCGLVYTALLFTATAGGPLEGALFMAAFGLGTLPAVMGAGILSDKLRRLSRRPGVRQVAGVALVVLGLAGVLFGGWLHGTAPLSSEHQALECRDERF